MHRSADRRCVLDATVCPERIQTTRDTKRRPFANITLEHLGVVPDLLDDVVGPVIGKAKPLALDTLEANQATDVRIGRTALQLVDVGDALDDVFAELSGLAKDCRFSDCSHESEPGCAVRAAIERGELDGERLRRYRKLLAEDRRNTETISERRSRDKRFGKMVRRILADKQAEKGGKS